MFVLCQLEGFARDGGGFCEMEGMGGNSFDPVNIYRADDLQAAGGGGPALCEVYVHNVMHGNY
jgi:hypothetical protein